MNKKRKKPVIFVCTTSYHPLVGGAEIAIQEVCRRLASSFDFVILTGRFRRGLAKREIRPEGTIIRLGLGFSFDKWLLPFLIFFSVLRRRGALSFPALLWGMDISQGSVGAALVKMVYSRASFILTLQYGGGEERIKKGRAGLLRMAFRFMLVQADEVTAISSYLGDLARKQGYKKEIVLVHNGADMKKFASHRPPATDHRPKRIITTSRLVHKNGIDVLIAAAEIVKKKFPDMECWIVGDGPERKNYQSISQDRDLSDSVRFFGSVSHEEVPRLLAQADVFVRPSRSEGMGNSFVEALASGLPVVGTPVEGILDIIEDGKTGLFSAVENPKDLAEKILYFFEHPECAKEMAKAGRKKVEQEFSWDSIAGQYSALFARALPRPRVLIATGLFPPAVGGPATYSKLLLDECPKQELSVDIADFGRVRRFPKIIRHIAYFFLLAWRARQADIVLALDPVSVGVPAACATWITGKPFVLKVAGDYAWEQGVWRFGVPDLLDEFSQKKYGWRVELLRRAQAWCSHRACIVIVPSKYLKKIVSRWGIPEDRIVVIFNAFTPPQFPISKKQARESLGLSGNVLVSAGRLVPWKGFDAVVDAVSEVREKILGVSCFVIGDGPERNNLESRIAERRLENAVTLLGAIPRGRLLLYACACDAFVLATGYEGFSHVILEAMAAGAPVITTPAGGNKELVEHGKTGFFCEYGKKESLVRALERFFSLTPEERQEMGKRAREKASEFGTDRMIRETTLLFQNVLAAHA